MLCASISSCVGVLGNLAGFTLNDSGSHSSHSSGSKSSASSLSPASSSVTSSFGSVFAAINLGLTGEFTGPACEKLKIHTV